MSERRHRPERWHVLQLAQAAHCGTIFSHRNKSLFRFVLRLEKSVEPVQSS
jgi:hypothetical protein